MSTLANENLIETLYEETFDELISNMGNLHLLFKQAELEAMAEKLALDKFYSNNI